MSRALPSSPQAQGSVSPSHRNTSSSSSFFDRFSRRPRTSGGTPIESQLESSPPPFAADNNSPSRRRPGGNPYGNGSSPSGLPRSSSSSHVHLDGDRGTSTNGIGFPLSSSTSNNPLSPSSSSQSPNSRRSNLGIGSRARPSTANAAGDSFSSNSIREREILAAGPGGPSSQNAVGGGGNPFGRMFRRYSQGAGKNNAAANEAHAIAAASYQNRVASASQVSLGGGGSGGEGMRSSPETPRRPTNGRAATSPPPTSPTSNPNNSHSNGSSSQLQESGLNPISALPAGLPNSQTLAVISDGTDTGTSNLDVSQDSTNSNLNSGSNDSSDPVNPSQQLPVVPSESNPTTTESTGPTLHRIRLVPHLEATRSLHFEPIERNLAEGAPAVKIGRFTDRAGPNNQNGNGVVVAPATSVAGVTDSASADLASQLGGASSSGAVGGAVIGTGSSSTGTGGASGVRVEAGRVAFKSKVVSRGHAELWCEPGGKFFIKDTRSSSGTFLNHIRLSAPSVESRPFALKDGDVVQLGVDYQGGTEEIYRCVKMRVELNRGWQRGRNEFNVNAMRQIRALQGTSTEPSKDKSGSSVSAAPIKRHSMSVTDCCICLFSVTVCQSLFIAPCSHVFHFKCIRPLLVMHHPGFSCPLCRTFADLEADVEQEDEWQPPPVKEPLVIEQPSEPSAIAATSSETGENAPSLAEAEAAGTSQAEAILLAAEAQQSNEEDPTLLFSSRSRGNNASEATARGSVLGVPSHIRSNTDWSRPDTAVSSASTARPGYFGAGVGSGASAVAAHQLGSRNPEGPETPPFDSPNLPLEEEEEGEELEVPSDLASGPRTAVGTTSSSSRPINIERSSSSNTAAEGGTRVGSPMDESNTPTNQHFFSTLAETSVASRSAAARAANQGGPKQFSRQASLLQPVMGDASASSNSSYSQGDISGDRRGSEASNQDSYNTAEHSPIGSPSNDQADTSAASPLLARQHQPLPRPPTSDTGYDDTGLEGTNRHVVGKGKASERRVASAASSTNRRNEINETDESQQEVSNRNSVGSTSGSSGSGGGKLSRLLKKAAGGLN